MWIRKWCIQSNSETVVLCCVMSHFYASNTLWFPVFHTSAAVFSAIKLFRWLKKQLSELSGVSGDILRRKGSWMWEPHGSPGSWTLNDTCTIDCLLRYPITDPRSYPHISSHNIFYERVKANHYGLIRSPTLSSGHSIRGFFLTMWIVITTNQLSQKLAQSHHTSKTDNKDENVQ